MSQSAIIEEIRAERVRQDEKWGEQNHPPFIWLVVLGEEVGEACEAALEAQYGGKPLANYRAELVQVAAVALAAIECLDRWETP